MRSAGCKKLLDHLDDDTSDATVGNACLLYKEGKYSEAQKLFTVASNSSGYQPQLAYNIALCFYQLKQYGPALKQIAEIIESGVTEHAELGVGAASNDAGVRSVGNSQVALLWNVCFCQPFSQSHVFTPLTTSLAYSVSVVHELTMTLHARSLTQLTCSTTHS